MKKELSIHFSSTIIGSYILKHNGIYYMTYSANSYESPFYGVGCATATDIMGEWAKYDENPLLQNPGGLVGVGHSAIEWTFINIRRISHIINSIVFENIRTFIDSRPHFLPSL